MTEPKYPDVEVQLSGEDGNAFMLIGKTRRALKRHDVSDEEIEQFSTEATSGDYNNVIATIGRWVTVI